MSIFSLAGKKALVVGASRGIGLAIAQGMAAAGAHTILSGRSTTVLESESAALVQAGFSASAVTLDVTSADSIERAMARLPDIDILVNSAGMNNRRAFESYSRAEYDQLLDTNLHGIVRLTQLAGARMIERATGGKIVNIGSLMSLTGLPFVSIYAITKGAILQLTRALAAEWGRYGIQVNCIAPGFILTDLNREMWKAPEMQSWLAGAQANPRLGRPEDIAPLAVFLAGAGSDYITGQIIPVDGGYTTTGMWPYRP